MHDDICDCIGMLSVMSCEKLEHYNGNMPKEIVSKSQSLS